MMVVVSEEGDMEKIRCIAESGKVHVSGHFELTLISPWDHSQPQLQRNRRNITDSHNIRT